MKGLIDFRDVEEPLTEPVEQAFSLVLIRNFSSLENNGRFDFMSVRDELQRVFRLEFEIVNIGVRVEPEFLHQAHVLMFLLELFFLLKFVLILAEIHDLADGRHGIRNDFNEVFPFLLSDDHCLTR